LACRCRSFALILLLAGTGAHAQAPAPADPAEPVRAEFRAALDRLWQPGPAPADSKALRAYVLYPYLQAGRLRKELSRVPERQRVASLEQRIQGFLERHADEPATRDLRRDWLAYLGERAAWAEFEAAARPQPPTDLSLRCHALTAQLVRKQLEGLREAAFEAWANHQDAPPACAAVFKWLDDPERLGDAEIEQRAAFAARNRRPLPHALRGLLPQRQALMRYWARLMEQPERELKLYLSGERPAGVPPLPDADVAELLLEAFTLIARRDSRQAAQLYEPLLQLPFADDQRQRVRREHALGLAYDFDPGALAAFRQVPEPALDPLAFEWRVRVALWHREWGLVQQWIQGMPEAQRTEPRWRYWLARSIERSHRAPARQLYEDVAKEREYYAFLAAERLGRKPDLRPQPVVPDPAIQATLASLAPIQRARELFRCDLLALATHELRHALRERTPAEKAQAAALVAGWGWFEPAVRLVSETQHWDDLQLRYPLPYQVEIGRAAKDTNLPHDWLNTVLRTESLYDPRAVSRVGALGLLQLMLPTARQVARKHGLPAPQRDDLFKPDVNIALGARYLRELQERFEQRFILTLAAYNAGPHRVPDWLPVKAVEGDIWIENIPFNETRAYVQRALSSLVFLSWRRTGDPMRLAPLLQPVAAPAAADGGLPPVASQ
jgi:soluble lytic murein transglycosylase